MNGKMAWNIAACSAKNAVTYEVQSIQRRPFEAVVAVTRDHESVESSVKNHARKAAMRDHEQDEKLNVKDMQKLSVSRLPRWWCGECTCEMQSNRSTSSWCKLGRWMPLGRQKSRPQAEMTARQKNRPLRQKKKSTLCGKDSPCGKLSPTAHVEAKKYGANSSAVSRVRDRKPPERHEATVKQRRIAKPGQPDLPA